MLCRYFGLMFVVVFVVLKIDQRAVRDDVVNGSRNGRG